MKDPCEDCLVLACCRQICVAKENYERHLYHQREVYLSYFKQNRGTSPINKQFQGIVDRIMKSNQYKVKILSR